MWNPENAESLFHRELEERGKECWRNHRPLWSDTLPPCSTLYRMQSDQGRRKKGPPDPLCGQFSFKVGERQLFQQVREGQKELGGGGSALLLPPPLPP